MACAAWLCADLARLEVGSSEGDQLVESFAELVVGDSGALGFGCACLGERGKSLVDGFEAGLCCLDGGHACGFELCEQSAMLRGVGGLDAPRALVSTGDVDQRRPPVRRRVARPRCRLPVLGERVCKLEPSDLSLRDQNLAQQPAVLSLNGERRFAIVGCDEPEVDENLADRAAEVRSERRNGWVFSDDRIGVGRPAPICAPAHLTEQARDIRLGEGELGNDDLVQRQTRVP